MKAIVIIYKYGNKISEEAILFNNVKELNNHKKELKKWFKQEKNAYDKFNLYSIYSDNTVLSGKIDL